MTNQEAIEELQARKEHYEMGDCTEELISAMQMGIDALTRLCEIEQIIKSEWMCSAASATECFGMIMDIVK